jgi:hydroxymethylbilane synthase
VASEFRLGTRGSQLALWQANTVAANIAASGGPTCRIVVIKTTGDHLQDRPLSEAGGKRLFVKEIEDAMLRGDIDLAVHSSKDMPAILPDGLSIAGVLPREEPFDAVVLPRRAEGRGMRESALFPHPSALTTIEDLVSTLGQTPVIGTSSVRRVAQLIRLFPGAQFQPIRGNLDTRLRKLDEGQHAALVLAAAGLRRLGCADRISMTLPVAACVPAPGQGIVAIETRSEDVAAKAAVAHITDARAMAALDAERAVVDALGGGCQTPIGALAVPDGEGMLDLVAAVIAIDGSRAIRSHARAPLHDARGLGHRVGARLLEEGAGAILEDVRRQNDAR